MTNLKNICDVASILIEKGFHLVKLFLVLTWSKNFKSCPIKFLLKREFFSVLMRHFPVGRVCSATSPVDFWSAECVLPHPWSFFSRQNVFCHLPGQFPVGRGGSEVFSGCQTSFSPIFPKTWRDEWTNLRTEKNQTSKVYLLLRP